MGHHQARFTPIRINWMQLFQYLENAEISSDELAKNVAAGMRPFLRRYSHDKSVVDYYYHFVSLIKSVKYNNFDNYLNSIGLDSNSCSSPPILISKILSHIRDLHTHDCDESQVSYLAEKSFAHVLTKYFNNSPQDFWSHGRDNIVSSIKEMDKNFTRVNKDYFATFFSNAILLYASNALITRRSKYPSNHSPNDIINIENNVVKYAHDASKILDNISTNWFGKRKGGYDLDSNDISKFHALALRKLRYIIEEGIAQ